MPKYYSLNSGAFFTNLTLIKIKLKRKNITGKTEEQKTNLYFQNVTYYEKSKKLILFCILLVLMTALSISASASTTDKYHYFYWDDTRVASTDAYFKNNDSATYFRVKEYTMPLNGFYIQTKLGTTSVNGSTYSRYFLINTYGGKTIKHNSYAKNKYASLRTKYPLSHYSWGDVTIAWSEDYFDDGSERLNW